MTFINKLLSVVAGVALVIGLLGIATFASIFYFANAGGIEPEARMNAPLPEPVDDDVFGGVTREIENFTNGLEVNGQLRFADECDIDSQVSENTCFIRNLSGKDLWIDDAVVELTATSSASRANGEFGYLLASTTVEYDVFIASSTTNDLGDYVAPWNVYGTLIDGWIQATSTSIATLTSGIAYGTTTDMQARANAAASDGPILWKASNYVVLQRRTVDDQGCQISGVCATATSSDMGHNAKVRVYARD